MKRRVTFIYLKIQREKYVQMCKIFVFSVRVQKITPVPNTSDQRLTEYDYKVMSLQIKIYY